MSLNNLIRKHCKYIECRYLITSPLNVIQIDLKTLLILQSYPLHPTAASLCCLHKIPPRKLKTKTNKNPRRSVVVKTIKLVI